MPTAFAARLLALRRERNLSQAAAARLIGVSQPTLAGWETGRYLPSLRSARRLLAALGPDAVHVEDLLGLAAPEAGQ